MQRILLLAIVLIATSMPAGAHGQSPISAEIAPSGKLRVAMNANTVVLLKRTSDGKITGGVGVELGKFIAGKFGYDFELVAYPDSNAYTQSFGKGEWDIGFGTQTPLVAEKAEFVLDVLLTDYMFVAAPGREFADAAQVDRPGVKIGVGLNSSSDQFLSRTLKSAELVRLTGGRSTEALSGSQADVWAASASNIQQVAGRVPGAKIVPGAFTSDRTMVILPKGRSSAAQATLPEIVNEAKKPAWCRRPSNSQA
ncbi:MAG: transporter substrate-binding domain-containing protein [Deltaproteobacteria bacterium]|nr:transporter substrate-binding domain-containing protein [Deltaproteobacteria bacterium]